MNPRLVDTAGAAAYLGISRWTVRAYVERGHLTPVRLPAARRRNEESRRLLFDVRDLDAWIDKQKGVA